MESKFTLYKFLNEDKYIISNDSFGFLLLSDNTLTKIWDISTIDITDESMVDSYMESRGLEKVLEFDGNNIIWYNDYDTPAKKTTIKKSTTNLVNNVLLKNQTILGDSRNKYNSLYVYAQILSQKI